MVIFNAKTIGGAAMGLAVSAILVSASAPAMPGDPVPGIDVSLEQIPGGLTINTQTDSTGSYVFDRLPPGTYVLRLSPRPLEPGAPTPQASRKNYNSSRSNVSHMALPGGGTAEHTVTFEESPTVLPGKFHDPGITITISRGGGRISGRVEDISIREEGVN